MENKRRTATIMNLYSVVSYLIVVMLVACLSAALLLADNPICDHGHHGPTPAPNPSPSGGLPNRRPPKDKRAFVSPAVDNGIKKLLNRTWLDPDLSVLFQNCLPNTLDTTGKFTLRRSFDSFF